MSHSFRQSIICFLLMGLIALTRPQFLMADDDLPGPRYSNNPIAAIVDGKPVFLDELRNVQVHELMVELFKIHQMMLKEKAIGMLSKSHPEIKIVEIPEVTRQDIARFYEATAEVKSMGTLDQVEDNIRQYLQGLNRAKYMKQVDEQYRTAVTQGWVKDFMEPPKDFQLVAQVGTAMRWFDEGKGMRRQIFFLEFSDFQCPFCKRVQPTLRDLRKRYAASVQFGYRHFPLPFHKEAKGLAEAVECAREQGKFWEFQSLVYQNVDQLMDREQVLSLAQKAGVRNSKKFQDCWNTGKYRERVQADVQDGVNIGINGTPTFIIGQYDPVQDTVTGEMFSGAVSKEKFESVIEKYLAEIPQQVAEPCLDC